MTKCSIFSTVLPGLQASLTLAACSSAAQPAAKYGGSSSDKTASFWILASECVCVCGVVWCGVVWCGVCVVWCGVYALLLCNTPTSGKLRQYTRLTLYLHMRK